VIQIGAVLRFLSRTGRVDLLLVWASFSSFQFEVEKGGLTVVSFLPKVSLRKRSFLRQSSSSPTGLSGQREHHSVAVSHRPVLRADYSRF